MCPHLHSPPPPPTHTHHQYHLDAHTPCHPPSLAVLEARGLVPRRGVVVALSASELPNPQVTLSLRGYPDYSTPVLQHSLTPRCAALLQAVPSRGLLPLLLGPTAARGRVHQPTHTAHRFLSCKCTTVSAQPLSPTYPPTYSPVRPSTPTHPRACRWQAHERHIFQRVDVEQAALAVRLWDDRGSSGLFRERRQLVGEGVVHCGHIKVRPREGGSVVLCCAACVHGDALHT